MLKILPRRPRPRLLGRLILAVAWWLAACVSNRCAAVRNAAVNRRLRRANRCLRRRITAMAEQRSRMRENELRLQELLAESEAKADALESKLALTDGEVLYLSAFQRRVLEQQKAQAAMHVARRVRADSLIEPPEPRE